MASREDKEAMFLRYTELLNALDSGATTKITINNRRLNKADFEQATLIPMAEDNLDKYHKEYNNMLLDKATGANSIMQDHVAVFPFLRGLPFNIIIFLLIYPTSFLTCFQREL